MAFSDDVKLAAWRRSGGKCECARSGHGHTGRCNKAVGSGTFHYHHVTSTLAGGPDTASNCEIICIPCHQLTASYGRS